MSDCCTICFEKILKNKLKITLINAFKSDIRSYRQLTKKISIYKKIFFYFQNIFRKNSLLVGRVQK